MVLLHHSELLARVKVNHRADLNTLGVVANQAAYADGEDWLDHVVDYIDGTHDFVARFISANMPLVKCAKPEGTYLAWLDVSAVADRIGAKACPTSPAGTERSPRPRSLSR